MIPAPHVAGFFPPTDPSRSRSRGGLFFILAAAAANAAPSAAVADPPRRAFVFVSKTPPSSSLDAAPGAHRRSHSSSISLRMDSRPSATSDGSHRGRARGGGGGGCFFDGAAALGAAFDPSVFGSSSGSYAADARDFEVFLCVGSLLSSSASSATELRYGAFAGRRALSVLRNARSRSSAPRALYGCAAARNRRSLSATSSPNVRLNAAFPERSSDIVTVGAAETRFSPRSTPPPPPRATLAPRPGRVCCSREKCPRSRPSFSPQSRNHRTSHSVDAFASKSHASGAAIFTAPRRESASRTDSYSPAAAPRTLSSS